MEMNGCLLQKIFTGLFQLHRSDVMRIYNLIPIMLIIVFFFFSGCFENNVRNENEGELTLIISSDKEIYNNNTNEIIINVTLFNENSDSIYVSEIFLKKGYMKIYILDDNGRNLTTGLVQYNILEDNRVELKPKEKFYYDYNLLDYTPLNDVNAHNNFEFPHPGSYTMYMQYKSKLISNTIHFTII